MIITVLMYEAGFLFSIRVWFGSVLGSSSRNDLHVYTHIRLEPRQGLSVSIGLGGLGGPVNIFS